MTITLYNRALLIATSITACAISACNDNNTTEPNQTTTYVLKTISGRALPTPRDSVGPSDTVTADTLVLDFTRNIATDKLTLHYFAGGSGTVTSESPMVSISGGVAIYFGCPANAFCIAVVAPTIGTFHNDTLAFVDAVTQVRRTYVNPFYLIQ